MSFYDAYLFINKNNDENFGIIELQTDNTLNIKTEAFIKKEKTKIIKAKLKAKT